jgi:hypothetical protein
MIARNNGAFVFDGPGANTASGTISITSGSSFTLWGEDGHPFTLFENNGTVTVDQTSKLTIAQRITGTGNIDVAGQLSLRSSQRIYGQPSISAALKLHPTSSVTIEMGMLGATRFQDKLLSSGPLTLDGTLHVDLDNLILPLPGEVFEVITYTSRIGMFDQITTDSNAHLFVPTYTAGALLLTVEATFIGDADLDGDVDLNDLTRLAANYGTQTAATWLTGDFDQDGDVDLADLAILAENYGPGSAQAMVDFHEYHAVPEPAWLGFIATFAVLHGRRRSYSRR